MSSAPVDNTEKPVKVRCIAILRARGWRVRNNPIGRFRLPRGKQCSISIGKRGEADVMAISPIGRLLYVETKRPKGGRFTPEQLEFAADMRTRGVPCVAISDPMELAAWLDERPWLEGRV